MVDIQRTKKGTLTRPQTWQRGLDLALNGVLFDRSKREVYNGRAWSKEAVGTRAEDFAEQYPDEAMDTLTEVVRVMAEEGDYSGALHWQRLADSLAEWQERPREVDPFTPKEPEPKKRNERKARNTDEIERFMDTINRRSDSGTRFYALALMLRQSGMRISEALNLEVKDFDIVAGTAFILNSKNGRSRTVLFPPQPEYRLELHDAMTKWFIVREKWNPKCDRVFTSRTGEPLNYQSVIRTFHKVSKRSGVTPDVKPHQLRHTYVSRLKKKGADDASLAQQLGHTVRTMRETYTHCIDQGQEEAVSKY